MKRSEFIIACITGASIAVLLMWLGWHSGSELRDTISFWVQFPGVFTATEIMRVLHVPIFELVAIAVNTIVYALLIMAVLKVRHSVAR